MKLNMLGRLLRGWFSTVRQTALVTFVILGVFLGMHSLGGGKIGELSYTLLLLAIGLGMAAVFSLIRYAVRQLALWQALKDPPLDPAALPPAEDEAENSFRELALGYQAARKTAEEQAAVAEQERLDYFTLWVHQIKTPISALDLMAQSEEPISREMLRQEVFKISQYADAALSYQRLRSLRNDLTLVNVPLYPLCCAMIRKLRPIFLYRKISLLMEPFEGVALSDAKWLGMALTQVLTNALKYTPEGGTITVSLREPLVLEIRNTGPGIRPEDLPRVFERGFTGRLGREAREGEASTGIGLYLCRQACDQLGHRLSIASVPGESVTVTFDLRREGFEAF